VLDPTLSGDDRQVPDLAEPIHNDFTHKKSDDGLSCYMHR